MKNINKMTETIARIRVGSKTFETMVDLEKAMQLRRGQEVSINEIIADTTIYYEQKKGLKASNEDLEQAFGTSNFEQVVEKIVKKGNLETTQEFRDEAVETKKKQIIEFYLRNAVDARTKMPFTPDMIESALKSSGAKIDNQPIDKQINKITEALIKVIPIKIETKKILIKIPAIHTGKAYGLVQDHKEKEEWLGDGSLQVILNIPIGLQMDFYDKLNAITHGSAITQEIKEK